jgi:hypothetical protein
VNRPPITAEGRTLAEADADHVIALRAELARQEGNERKRQAHIRRECTRWKVHLVMPSGSVARLSRFQPMAWR